MSLRSPRRSWSRQELHPTPESLQRAAAKRASVLEAIGRSLDNPDSVALRDKFIFLLGIFNLAAVFFIMGRCPEVFYRYWLGSSALVFTLRWLSYRFKGHHYLMLEFCYGATLLAAVHVVGFPQHALLRKVTFSMMSGPAGLCTIVLLKNLLIFHSFDKMATWMMHWGPSVLAWTLRWHPHADAVADLTAAQRAAFDTASWYEMLVLPMAGWLLWAVPYYLLIFVLLERRIRGRGYPNMFTIMVTDPRAQQGALSRTIRRCPPRLQPLAYLGVHSFATFVAVLPQKFLFDSYVLHTASLVATLAYSAWQGATYYFQVFAQRQIRDLSPNTQGAKAATAKAA